MLGLHRQRAYAIPGRDNATNAALTLTIIALKVSTSQIQTTELCGQHAQATPASAETTARLLHRLKNAVPRLTARDECPAASTDVNAVRVAATKHTLTLERSTAS